MRRPSLDHHDGDLSRLTSASSPAEGSIAPCQADEVKVDIAPSYLPKIIEPLDWHNTRKRKERQDSTSSQTQDRKLVRSNSEEHISVPDVDVIRRVSSHEDFKKPLPPHIVTLESHHGGERDPGVEPARMSPSHEADRSDGEHERRRSSERFSRTRAPPGRKALSPRKPAKHVVAKMRDRDENLYKYDNSALKHERRGFVSRERSKPKEPESSSSDLLSPVSDFNDNNLIDLNQETESTVPQEILPWNVPFHEDTPVVCPRFADNTFDHVHASETLAKARRESQSLIEMKTDKFTSIENLKTRDIMKKMPNVAITPDERVKQINSRLSKLKKRVAQFEENFEKDYGYKPPRIETMNDKAMKSIVSEIQKLKREKHCIKSDPVMEARDSAASEQHGEMKLSQMQETLTDIEMVLQERRKDENRPAAVEELSVEQLMQEKTSIQRGLLYLESIFGRPSSREERDLARPLYDRYRQVKRMLNRSSVLNGSGVGVAELPTILEHEAMAFTVTATPSTDVTPPSVPSAVESPSETTVSSSKSTDSTEDSSVNENVHTLSIRELWQQLDAVRDEKRDLRRTIKEFEHSFEKENGRKMLKSDRKAIEETYALYKQKKGKLRLLDALVKKHMSY
ncbi:protein FAM13A isoform X2 [Phlebotomus argentipes]|nr:protein FAM13A isoform X2 [Phlebotomus argentipes]XP_059616192.1 protein FAM13A isoform X2 [Phlebotomus argentipes]